MDYPLFSWVVVIPSLHVSSFREAHHQEIIFPVQSASGIVYNLCCSPPVLLRSGAEHVGEREGYSKDVFPLNSQIYFPTPCMPHSQPISSMISLSK